MKKQTKSKVKTGAARLMELAGERKKPLVFACILAVLSSAARLVPFFTIYGILKELVKNYNNINQINSNYIFTLIIFTFASALVYGVFGFFSSALSHRSAFDIIYILRLKLMNKLGKIPSGFFTHTTQGAIKKTLSDDTEQIEGFIAHHISEIAAAIAMPVFTLIYLFIIDWRLALVTLFPIIASIFILSAGLKNPKGAKTQVDMHDSKEKMNGTIVEYIHGMPVIKIFNRTLSAFKRYETDVTNFVKTVDNTAYHFASGISVYYVFFGAQLLFLLPAGILLSFTATSYLDFLPLLLLFFIVGSGLKEPMENMMQMIVHSRRISEGVARIDRILLQPELSEDGKGNPDNYGIRFENVSFSYENDGQNALKKINISLDAGTITGIVGPSGGGKSTLAQLLLRFYEPQNGCIKIGGVDIKDIPPSRLTSLISYVFQDSFLFKDTIENNIRMGNTKAAFSEVENAAKNAGIHDVIMSLPNAYQTVIGEKNSYLSGGEGQRIAIARVFLKNTPIIILDEATAYADAENEAKIQSAFAQLAKNKTVLIIAHRLRTIENANKILVLKDGELLAFGSHKELMKTSLIYQNMVDANERRERWTIRKEVLNNV